MNLQEREAALEKAQAELDAMVQDALADHPEVEDASEFYADLVAAVVLDLPRDLIKPFCMRTLGWVPMDAQRWMRGEKS